MNRNFYTIKTLLIGFFTAQILATIHVYLSNTNLYLNLIAIENAGYLVIPNRQIMANLNEFAPAFFGGLFFSLTLGAGLTIFTFAVVWVWDRLFSRNKFFLIFFLLFLIGCVAVINHRGFCPMITSYFIVIPAVTFIFALKWMPLKDNHSVLLYLIPLALLGFLWAFQMSNHIFYDIRDHLLLSNSMGTKINDLYYKYTLYPAQVFKPLAQKTLKTCSFEHINQKSSKVLLERELRKHDYLDIGENNEADLKISGQDNILIFKNRGKIILQTSIKDFISSPLAVLKEFSIKSDRHYFFRQFVLFSILTGFPIALYTILHALFSLVMHLFFDSRISTIIASILCFSIGAALLLSLHFNTKTIDTKNPTKIMENDSQFDKEDRQAVQKILKKIHSSDSWYDQLNAYKTLRTLGWKQTRSK
jgi:hypothetical protein